MVQHTCPHCGCGKKAHATTSKHKCKNCGSTYHSLDGGFGWGDVMNLGKQAVSTVQNVASNPLAQAAFKMAAPAAMNLANKYAPGAVSAAQKGMKYANMAQQAYANPAAAAMQLANKYAPGAMSAAQSTMSNPYAQAAMANPYAQAGMSAARKRVGLGRNCGGVQLRDPTAGEVAHAQMRAAGRKRRGGKKGASPMDMASQVLGAIPGAAEALGPFGALLGLEAPPPPPPRATFTAVRQGPMVAARPRTLGRGRRSKRGGFGWGDVMNLGKQAVSTVQNVASNPLAQAAFKMAAPAAMNLANKYAPGAVSAAQKGMKYANMAQQAYANPAAAAMQLANKYAPGAMSAAQSTMSNPYAQAAMANPYAQAGMSAARKRVGLGRRTRPPTAHSQAVGKVMRESGMSLPEASRYVKQNGLAY